MMEQSALEKADLRYEKAINFRDSGSVNTSLANLRMAVNELLLAYYWHYGILPRSQNRTVYLLKKNSKIIGNDILYNAFVDIFCLKKQLNEMKIKLGAAKEEIRKVSKTWGDGAFEFLEKAVDIDLEWGYRQSITYVYKWCMHLLHIGDIKTGDYCDSKDFINEFPNLNVFLDFDGLTKSKLRHMMEQYLRARKII